MIQANLSDGYNCMGLTWYIANRSTLTVDTVPQGKSADASAPVYRVDNPPPSRLYIYNSRITTKVSEDVVVLSCLAKDTVVILRYDQLPPSTQLAPSTETTLVPTASVVQPTPTQSTRPSASTCKQIMKIGSLTFATDR